MVCSNESFSACSCECDCWACFLLLWLIMVTSGYARSSPWLHACRLVCDTRYSKRFCPAQKELNSSQQQTEILSGECGEYDLGPGIRILTGYTSITMWINECHNYYDHDCSVYLAKVTSYGSGGILYVACMCSFGDKSVVKTSWSLACGLSLLLGLGAKDVKSDRSHWFTCQIRHCHYIALLSCLRSLSRRMSFIWA